MALIPTIGHRGLAQILAATSNSYYMVFGSGTSSEAAGNTALASQFTTGSFEPVIVDPVRTDNILTWSKTITSTTNYTITEVGILQSTNLIARILNSSAITVIDSQDIQTVVIISI